VCDAKKLYEYKSAVEVRKTQIRTQIMKKANEVLRKEWIQGKDFEKVFNEMMRREA